MAMQPTATLRLVRGATSDGDDLLELTPRETDVLVVSTSRSMSDVVRDWRSAVGSLPAEFGLISFAEFSRSATAQPADTRGSEPSRRSLSGGDITLTSMADPGNLQRLGTAVTLYLDDWADSDRETVVYVDALSPLIDANDVESAFQFLHLLIRTVEGSEGTLTVRLDPDAVGERTTNTLRPLFDHVADHTTDASTIDTDTMYDLLGNGRRRFALRTLFDECELGLDRLAARLARWENETDDPTTAECERAYTALASVHLPQLAEAGVVRFDRETERVCLAAGADHVDRIERLLNWSPDEE
jgi:hypothetical protein